ncbi:hypothetical protein AZ16_2428 [Bordetella bronchiseptica B18-5 (C3)]|nr:hypothetical protein AZ16_2428 [Bordetella bronchiseptica B18-5 (C3)]
MRHGVILRKTTMGWPSSWLMRCVTRRAMMSVEPPGANGTITRMALLG